MTGPMLGFSTSTDLSEDCPTRGMMILPALRNPVAAARCLDDASKLALTKILSYRTNDP